MSSLVHFAGTSLEEVKAKQEQFQKNNPVPIQWEMPNFSTVNNKWTVKGFIIKNPCKTCHGTGGNETNSTIDITIPKNITDGYFIKFESIGDIISEWVVKGAFIKSADFGEYNWDTENTAVNITMTVQPDYCILNF